MILINNESSAFYFIQGAAEESALSDPVVALASVPPGAFRRVSASVVTGYFFVPGRTTHPGLRVRSEDDGATVRLVVPDQADFMVEALVPPDTGAPVRLDNRYLDWTKFAAVSRFSRHHQPDEVYRTDSTGTRVTKDSRLFGRGGSDLEVLRAITVDEDLYLMIGTYSGLSPGFSLMLYGFESASDGTASFTFEVALTDELPAVLLWRPAAEEPIVVGTFTHTTFFLEAVVWADQLPDGVAATDMVEFFEVSTSLTDAQITEEFPYGRLWASEIPAADG
jgi:hypothetical protein